MDDFIALRQFTPLYVGHHIPDVFCSAALITQTLCNRYCRDGYGYRVYVGGLWHLLSRISCAQHQGRQFGWEVNLLIGGVRSASLSTWEEKLSLLVVNSLLETNLGMPYIYGIFIWMTARFTEQLRHRPSSLRFTDRIIENHQQQCVMPGRMGN